MRKTLTSVIVLCVISISIFLQANLLEMIPLNGTSANIGIILIASLGLICGKFVGGVTGAVYGLIYDVSFGRAIGLYTGMYILVGLISGTLNKNFSKDNKISMILLFHYQMQVMKHMVILRI